MNSILGGILVGFFFTGVGLVIVGMILDRKYKAMLSKRLLALKCRYNGYITMNFSFTLLFCIALEKHLDVDRVISVRHDDSFFEKGKQLNIVTWYEQSVRPWVELAPVLFWVFVALAALIIVVYQYRNFRRQRRAADPHMLTNERHHSQRR